MTATAPRTVSPPLRNPAIPIILGLLAAALSTFILLAMGLVWLALFLAGVAVVAGGFMAKDLGRYWTIIFLFTIPLRMGKMFLAEPADVMAFVEQFGQPQGALPVPVLLLADLPFFMMLAIYVLRFLGERSRIHLGPVVPVAAGLIAWTALTIITSKLRILGVMELLRQAEYVLIFLIVAQLIRERRDLWAVVGAIAASVSFQAIYTILQYKFNITLILFGADATTVSNSALWSEGTMMVGETGALAETPRGSGTLGHPNLTAHYFEMWVPLIAAFAITARNRAAQLLLGACVILAGAGLFFTFSRGGAVALGIGLVAAFFALRHGGYISRRATQAVFALGILATVVAAPVGYWYMTTRPEMFKDRFQLMDVGARMAVANPLLGVGLNNYKANFTDYRSDSSVDPHPLHNYYLLLIAERGVPALLIFVFFLVMVLRLAWTRSESKDPWVAAAAAGVFGMLAAVAIHMNFDTFTDDPGQRSFWFLIGLLVALSKFAPAKEKERNAAPASAGRPALLESPA